jgi:SNF2 domain-containing protein
MQTETENVALGLRRADVRDWWIANWAPIHARTRLAPIDVPGVRELRYGASRKAPWPHQIHRTHFPQLGLELPDDAVPLAAGAAILRAHQLEGVRFIRARRGTLLADEPRVGKTPQVTFAHDPNAGIMAVLGPVAARAAWHEWAARRWKSACVIYRETGKCAICERVGATAVTDQPSFLSLEGRTFRPELIEDWRPRAFFATYAILPRWRGLFSKLHSIGTLAFDEAHLSGAQNRNSVTVESLRFLNTISAQVVACTGTPIFNRVRGVWPLLDLCAPAAFGDYWAFAVRYCAARPGAHGWTDDGESNAVELRTRMTEIMLRRRWVDVTGSLPPITRSLEIVRLPDKAKDEVEALAGRLRYLEGGAKTLVGDLARLRKLYAEHKVPAAVDQITSALVEGHSCVAWAWHESVAQTLVERLQGRGLNVFGPITGATAPMRREAILEAAAAASGPRVLVANMATLGFAVSLAWATHQWFVELDWNPPTICQAELRPFDGTHPVASVYLVADVNADERLANALIAKLETQSALGLRAGVGDVAELLADSFGITGGDNQRTLDALAERIMASADGEV